MRDAVIQMGYKFGSAEDRDRARRRLFAEDPCVSVGCGDYQWDGVTIHEMTVSESDSPDDTYNLLYEYRYPVDDDDAELEGDDGLWMCPVQLQDDIEILMPDTINKDDDDYNGDPYFWGIEVEDALVDEDDVPCDQACDMIKEYAQRARGFEEDFVNATQKIRDLEKELKELNDFIAGQDIR